MPPFESNIGAVNWLGIWTLYLREVHRFTKVYLQTLAAPVAASLLFLAIFNLAFDTEGRTIAGFAFTEFLAPGLIMMSIIQNAYANTTSSLMIAKFTGTVVDILTPPLTSHELTVGFALGGVTRGIIVAAAVFAGLRPFVPIGIHSFPLIAFHTVAAALMLSLLGILTAIWADKFDHIASITNFIVMPLSFLSGTFYSIERLPGVLRTITQFNPFFYAIDGLRFGFLGHADASIAIGVAMMTGLNVVLWVAVERMFARGYKLKT